MRTVAVGVLLGPIALAAIATAGLVSATSPAEPSGDSTSMPAIEEQGSELRRALVEEGGALDIYWDGSQYVVVLPAGQRAIDPSILRGLDLPAPLHTSTARVRQDDIDSVMHGVAELARSDRKSFVTYLDVYSGMVVVEGPANFRSQVVDMFPDGVTYVDVDADGAFELLADRNS